MFNRSLITLSALVALAVAGCFLLPPDEEQIPDGSAGPGNPSGGECVRAGDVCKEGTCVDVSGKLVCSHLCQKWGDWCEGGYCLDVADQTICNQGCGAIGAYCETGVCYYVQWQGGFYCMNPGAKKPGEPCKYPNECSPGFQCLERENVPTVRCYDVCDTHGCGNGNCTDTGLGFSVCLEPGA